MLPLLLLQARAHAESPQVAFADVLAFPRVLHGTVAAAEPDGCWLDVDLAYRGTEPLGRFHLDFPCFGPVGGERFVFLDTARGAVAVPWKDGSDLFVVRSDDPDTVVTSDLVTRAQLESGLAGDKVTWTFRGPLLLPSADGPVASGLELQVVSAGASGVLRGLPAVSGTDVGTFVWGEQLLVNSESVRPGEPSFALAGELTGPNPDGSIGVRFRLRDPDVYTVPDLATFLGDPGLAAARYEATVRRTRGARCRILYERGGSTLICGWRRRALEERIVGDTVRQRVYTSTDLRLELSPRGRPDPEYVGLPADLLPGPLTCTWTEHGRTVPCVVSDLRTTFRRR